MKTIIFIGLIFSLSIAKASDVEEVMKKMHAVYKTKTLSFNTTYSLFKGHFNKEVHSSYTGEIFKSEEGTYQKIKNTEFVYGKDFTLQISHDEKAMVVSNAQEAFFGNVDFEEVMKKCRSNKIIEKEDIFIIIFQLNITSRIPYSTITLKIDRSNYTLKQLDLYYSSQEDFSTKFEEKDLHQPHLQIEFNDISFKPNMSSSLLMRSTYLKIKNSALITTDKYKDYKLIDNRIKQ